MLLGKMGEQEKQKQKPEMSTLDRRLWMLRSELHVQLKNVY